MLDIIYTSKFKRDLKLAKKQNKNIDLLFDIIEQLANQKILESKYHDHQLSGNFSDYRECHITPDWLLIYKIDNNQLVLLLNRLGSHSNLF